MPIAAEFRRYSASIILTDFQEVMLGQFTGDDGNDLIVASLLVLTMTFLLLRTGLNDPVGIAALVLQIGLLIRMNYVHSNSVRQVEQKAKA